MDTGFFSWKKLLKGGYWGCTLLTNLGPQVWISNISKNHIGIWKIFRSYIIEIVDIVDIVEIVDIGDIVTFNDIVDIVEIVKKNYIVVVIYIVDIVNID